MTNIGKHRVVRGLATVLVIALAQGASSARSAAVPESPPAAKVPSVSAEIALSSLIALGDAHLQHLADSLKLVATTDKARSASWNQVRGPLQEAARLNPDAMLWFALPDGSYWTVQEGRISQKLSGRPYFRRLMAGQTVIGDLVVSKSTGTSVGIVAVPIRGTDGAVVGALGASVALDRLSARLEREMDLDDRTIFYSFDSNLVLGLVWDPSLILSEAHQLSKEVGAAFEQMRMRRAGVQSYSYRGKHRTVVFRKSDVTGWWYAFGVIPEGREPRGGQTRG
jgi:methyl-accepting chemotaxis protein